MFGALNDSSCRGGLAGVMQRSQRENVAVMLNHEELIWRSDGGAFAESGVLEVEELFAKDWLLAGDKDQHRAGRDDALRLALTFLDWSW